MDYEAEQDLEQIKRLDKLRKLIQTILGTHLGLLSIVFALVLIALMIFISMQVAYSPTRYVAKLTLCFHPKHKGKIGQYDDKFILRLLTRRSLRRNFASRGDGRDYLRQRIVPHIHITTDKKQPHNFSIELHAQTEKDAVAFINEFADVCIREYSEERIKDLKNWKEVLEEEKQTYLQDLAKINTQISELLTPLQMVSPEKDLERLRLHINELQSASTRLGYAVENLTRRKEQLEAELNTVNPLLLTHQAELKKFFRELDQLNRAITVTAELYTEENPKMIALISRRNAIQKQLDAFLQEKQIKTADPMLIQQAETLSANLKSLMAELSARENQKRALDGEIAECNKRYQLYGETQPRLQQLAQQKKNLMETKARLDESIAEISYMQLMVKEDLFISERTKSAIGNQPFAIRNIALAIVAAIMLTAIVATLIALLEYLFGAVANARELTLFDEFTYLGVLPTSQDIIKDADREKMTFNAVLHQFQAVNPPVTCAVTLPGAKLLPQIYDFIQWNFALEGKRTLLINVVLAESFKESAPPDGTVPDTMQVVFSGTKCYLPLSDPNYMVPSEQELLKSDLKVLREHYDYIFIRPDFPLRRSRLLLEQIAPFCDALLFAVGAGKTPRKTLRSLLALHAKINMPMMTILTDNAIKKLNDDLKLETES